MFDLAGRDAFGARSIMNISQEEVVYYRLARLTEEGITDVSRLPYSIKVLLESVLRNENGVEITRDDVLNVARYDPRASASIGIPFKPARVLMQDFTGVPALVDLAALRSAMARFGKDPLRIDPQLPVDLVIDHSVQVDVYNRPDAPEINAGLEFERNRERFEFLHWGQKSFQNLRVVPPVNGICHQVNLEYLGQVVQRRSEDEVTIAYPDSLVGTDSHLSLIHI